MLDSYATEQVQIATPVFDKWGAAGTPVVRTVRAQVDYGNRLVSNERGQQVVSVAVVRVPRSQGEIFSKDLIRLDGVDRTIITVRPIKAFATVFGWEALL